MSWKNRFFRLFIYSVLLLGLILYGRFFHPFVTLKMCLNEPEKYDGSTIIVGNEAVIKKIFKDGFSIVQMGVEIRVFGPTDVEPGEFVVLQAVFHKPDRLESIKIRIAKKRRSKIWLSVFPAILVVFYFLRQYRFNFSSLYFEER